MSDAGLMLVDHIIARLDEATDADFGPSNHPN